MASGSGGAGAVEAERTRLRTERLQHDLKRLLQQEQERLADDDIRRLEIDQTVQTLWSMDEAALIVQYQWAQKLSRARLPGGKKKQVISAKVGSDAEDQEVDDVLTGGVDYRVMRLSALLTNKSTKGKESTGEERFKATVKFLGGPEHSLVASRYAALTGRPLEADITTVFGSHRLRAAYLQGLRGTGRPSQAGRLCARLGLLYAGSTPFTTRDKQRVALVVRQDPVALKGILDDVHEERMIEFIVQALSGLEPTTYDDVDGDELLLGAAYNNLRRSGIMGEIRALVAMHEPNQADGTTPKTEQQIAGDHVGYLRSLIINEDKGKVRNVRYAAASPAYTLDTSKKRIEGLRDDVLKWFRTMATPDQQRAFVLAGLGVYGMPVSEALRGAGTGSKLAPYTKFWRMVKQHEYLSPNKAVFVLQMCEATSAHGEEDKQGRVAEIGAQLDFQSDRALPKRRLGRDGILVLVKQYLSAPTSGEWSPQRALIERYLSVGALKHLDKLDKGPEYMIQFTRALEQAWTEFVPKLIKAGLNSEQVAEAREMVTVGGSAGAADPQTTHVDNYIRLRSLVRAKGAKNFRNFDVDEAIDLIRAMETDTLEWTLTRNDEFVMGEVFARCAIKSSKGVESKAWKAIAAMLGMTTIPLRGRDLYNVHKDSSDNFGRAAKAQAMPAPETLTTDEVGTQLTAAPGVTARNYAGRLSAEHRRSGDGNRMLELAFKAQQARVSGVDVRSELDGVDPKLFETIATASQRFWQFRAEASAWSALYTFLLGGKITVNDALDASRAVTKLGVDTESRDFALQLLDEDNIFDHVDMVSYERLVAMTDKRLTLRLELFEEEQKPAPDQAVTAKKQAEIHELTERIVDTEVLLDAELLQTMKNLSRTGQFATQKRALYDVMSRAYTKGGGSSIERLRMSESELQLKGMRTHAKVEVMNQKYLETGTQWDHRSTASMESSEGTGMMLDSLWSNQREIARINGKDPNKVTKTDDENRTRRLKELKQQQGELDETQKHFAATQKRLNAQTKKIVAIAVALMITIAGLSVGVGAMAGVFQLVWLIGTSLAASAVDQFTDWMLSNEGDFSKAEAAKATAIKLLTDVVGFAIANELTLAVDLWGMGIHESTDAAVNIFGKAGLGIIKGQINSIVGGVPETVVNRMFTKHPISDLASDIGMAFAEKVKALPAEAIVGFMKGVVGAGLTLGQKELFAKLGASELGYTSTGAMNPQGYDSENRDAELRGLFGGGNLNKFSVFSGSPNSNMGADNALWGGDGGYDVSKIPTYIAQAIKTAVYEEVVMAQIKDAAGNATKSVIGATVDTVRGSGARHAERQAGLMSTPEKVEEAGDPTVVQIVAGYLRNIGLRVPDSSVQAMKDHIERDRGIPDSERGRWVAMIDTLVAQTTAVLAAARAQAQAQQAAAQAQPGAQPQQPAPMVSQ